MVGVGNDTDPDGLPHCAAVCGRGLVLPETRMSNMTKPRPEPSPELLELSRKAAAASETENAKVAAMTLEEREKYINDWAKWIAQRMADLGESESPI